MLLETSVANTTYQKNEEMGSSTIDLEQGNTPTQSSPLHPSYIRIKTKKTSIVWKVMDDFNPEEENNYSPSFTRAS